MEGRKVSPVRSDNSKLSLSQSTNYYANLAVQVINLERLCVSNSEAIISRIEY